MAQIFPRIFPTSGPILAQIFKRAKNIIFPDILPGLPNLKKVLLNNLITFQLHQSSIAKGSFAMDATEKLIVSFRRNSRRWPNFGQSMVPLAQIPSKILGTGRIYRGRK